MLLRDEKQMALNDIESRCMEAADHYDAAARRVHDDELRQLFAELAASRRRQARELAPHIRALGDLPKAPDADQEDMRELLYTIIPLLSGDQRASLINEREQADRELLQSVDCALRQPLPAEIQADLATMRDTIAGDARRLAEHRPA